MKIVAYNLPFLFGSAVGMKYLLEGENGEYLDRLVGVADMPWDAINVVQNIFTSQGTIIDPTKYFFHEPSVVDVEIPDRLFEKTLLKIRELGLTSWAVKDNKLKIYPVSLSNVEVSKFTVTPNVKKLLIKEE